MELAQYRKLLRAERIKNEKRVSPEELKNFMNHQGISVTELGEILGVTHTAVVYWLSGHRILSRHMSKLIRLFIKHPNLLREF